MGTQVCIDLNLSVKLILSARVYRKCELTSIVHTFMPQVEGDIFKTWLSRRLLFTAFVLFFPCIK